MKRTLVLGLSATLVVGGMAAAPALADSGSGGRHTETIELKDARLKFEINATDGDGGVQLFIDGEQWERLTMRDPHGRRLFTSRTAGAMAEQGVTELFFESAEPTFDELPLPELLERFPEGEYRFRGRDVDGNRLVGSAVLTHQLPDGPELVFPLEGDPPQDPEDTMLEWRAVDPPAGSSIIGYQVLVVLDESDLPAIPKIALDVIVPPTVTTLTVPAGFLQAGAEYEWEVLAIEESGNQTLSSSFFATTG